MSKIRNKNEERDWMSGSALCLPTTKNNHDTMVHNQKQFTDMFRKHRCYARSYQLDYTVISECFVSISNVVQANQNEEVWLDLEFYGDRKYMDDVVASIESDELAQYNKKYT